MIEIKNIVKEYNGKKVVDKVSFSIEEGTITSFIGPNGAGKSTVLAVISRLIPKNQGEVLIDGKRLEDWDNKELSKRISILKQTNHVSIRLTIRELVSFGRFPHSNGNLTKEDEAFIDKAIAYMKLTDMEDKYLDELSGGQRQRAYIAMVIAQDTPYILLDEPLNNLDMKHSVEIMRILRDMVNELKKTIIIVVHDINFASCYSDNMIVLKNGRLCQAGATDGIINKETLEEIYEMDFTIEHINNKKICVYF